MGPGTRKGRQLGRGCDPLGIAMFSQLRRLQVHVTSHFVSPMYNSEVNEVLFRKMTAYSVNYES